MIENYLRQITTVRSRILAGNVALFILFLLSVPLIYLNQTSTINQFQEINSVEVHTDRLLLQASAKIASSRTNLNRYIQGAAPSPADALEDTDEAVERLEEAVTLPAAPEQTQSFEEILDGLVEYEGLINQIETSRSSGQGQMASLEAQALQLGSDLGVRIDQTIQESANRVTAANEALLSTAQNRIFLLIFFIFILVILALSWGRLARLSITNPIADLQTAAEQFSQGKWETPVPVSGNDELTKLAITFNQMAADLIESQTQLERRVAQRTRSLEMSAEISGSLSSILDQSAFSIAVVEQLQETFGYYYVQLYLMEDSNDSMLLKSATGLTGQKMLIRGHRIQLGQGIVGLAASNRAVIVAPDVFKHPDWLDNPLLPETKSEAAIPILSHGTLLGVLDIQHNVIDGINEEELALLRTVSNQIAVALENSRLFEQIQQRARHEALLNQLTQKIQVASSVDQVLQITAQELGKALSADFITVELGKSDRPANGHEKVR